MDLFEQKNKNLIAAYHSNYSRKIILTLEEILKSLGAGNIHIDGNLMKFSSNYTERAINIKRMMNKIFCAKGGEDLFVADTNLLNEEKMYDKALKIIEQTLNEVQR